MRKICLLLAMLILISCFVGCAANDSTNDVSFKDLINETLELYPYTLTLAAPEDYRYMTFKINPNLPAYDIGPTLDESLYALKHINNKLGFSPALYEKMVNTTEVMGLQTESNDKILVTWSYKESDGLYVIYEKN